jgi:hypothetical protein
MTEVNDLPTSTSPDQLGGSVVRVGGAGVVIDNDALATWRVGLDESTTLMVNGS